jgi:hypothetical protein
MDELITWLRAQLDDDERVARRAGWNHPEWTYDREMFTVASDAWVIAARKDRSGSPINDVDGEHIARWDPARVLAEVDAKRRILDMWADAQSAEFPDYWGGYATALDDVVRQLALPCADRPGFRAEWRP